MTNYGDNGDGIAEMSHAPGLKTETESQSLIGQVMSQFQVVFRHKLLILFVTALGVAAGYYYLQHQQAIYRASAKVMIDRSPPKILSNVKEVVELGTPMFFGTDAMYFQSQYEIIKSTDVSARVLDRLGLWNDEHLLGLDNPDLEMTDEEKRQAISDAHMPTVLASRIEVRPIQKSMLVAVEFEDSDEEFAQQIVNAVAEAYKEQNIAHKKKTVTDATEKLQELADEWKKKLVKAETQVRNFEKEHSVGTIPNTRKAIDGRLEELNSQLTKVSIEISTLKAKVKSVSRFKKPKKLSGIDAGVILQDPTVMVLKRQIFELESKLAGLKIRYMERHPEVMEAAKKLKSLRRSVKQQIKDIASVAPNNLREARNTERDLKLKLEASKKEELHIADVERRYAELVEVQKQAKIQYEDVNKRLVETSMSVQVATNNIRVIDPAVAAIQVRPRRLLVMGGSLILAFLLALILAFLVENADIRIRSWSDLEEGLGFKVIGVLPVISREGKHNNPEDLRNRDFYMHLNPNSAVAESYRTLRTNLLFMGTDRPLNTLLVTSAAPSEGKSTVAINTAVSMAASGKKILLVEADMRRPRLARSFHLNEDRGLSTWLAVGGKGDEHIQASSVPGVDLLVCGPVPPNPAELLHSKRFEAVLAEMKENYDTVIFDSPPVLPVSDSLSLANRLDGCVIVVRAGRTTRHMLRDCKRQLLAVRAPVLGAVLNHQEQSKQRGYYRGKYGHGYGYGAYGAYGYRANPVEGDGAS
jgi:polysaccharide biosynthesis transport protein